MLPLVDYIHIFYLLSCWLQCMRMKWYQKALKQSFNINQAKTSTITHQVKVPKKEGIKPGIKKKGMHAMDGNWNL